MGGSYRCVPCSYSYVDKDDPPSWTLQIRFLGRDGPGRSCLKSSMKWSLPIRSTLLVLAPRRIWRCRRRANSRY